MNARTAAALLAAASLAVPALAREIPPALLAHETKLRASLTPAQQAHLAGITSRLTPTMNVSQASALARGESPGDIFLVLMEYMKLMNKENREDAKLARESRQLSLQAKAEKIKLDNKAIDDNMREAEQKATNLMNAATTGLTTGIVTESIQTAGAAAGARKAPTHTPTPVPRVIGTIRR